MQVTEKVVLPLIQKVKREPRVIIDHSRLKMTEIVSETGCIWQVLFGTSPRLLSNYCGSP